jgi:hypothetical protein
MSASGSIYLIMATTIIVLLQMHQWGEGDIFAQVVLMLLSRFRAGSAVCNLLHCASMIDGSGISCS